MSKAFSGYGYAMLAAGLWALIGPVSRLCFTGGIEPLEVAFWRALIGGACFLAHGLVRHEMGVRPLHGLYFSLFGLVGVGLFFSSYQVAVKESGAALAVVLMYTAPAWVALFARVLFKEPVTRRKALSLGLAMCGTILVCLSGGSMGLAPAWLGIACGLGAGLFYATHYPFYVWWQKRYNTSTIYTFMLLAGAVVLFPLGWTGGEKSALAWGGLIFMGVFCTYGAYLAYGQGLRRLSPIRTAVISNLEPVLGTLLAMVWWGERFLPLAWAGSALVLFAVILLTTENRSN